MYFRGREKGQRLLDTADDDGVGSEAKNEEARFPVEGSVQVWGWHDFAVIVKCSSDGNVMLFCYLCMEFTILLPCASA